MRDFFDRYFFVLLMAGICGTLASHALKHQSHHGAALWMIAFILVIYLRELAHLGHERIKIFQENDKLDASYQRDINHITYNAETDTWTKEVKND